MNPLNEDYNCIKINWNPEKWDIPDKYHEHTNCYAYALNKIIKKNAHGKKLQPGDISGEKFKNYECNEIITKVNKDLGNYGIRKLNTMDEDIECTNYKIALVIDNHGKELDYHFYRQDNNGLWSHKRGKNKITNVDASNNLIYDPKIADRNYDKIGNDDNNYSIFCGYYSIPYTTKL